MKLFCNHVGKFKSDSGEIKPLGRHDPDLRVEIIFRKERTAESGDIDFEIVDTDTSAYWY